MALGGEEEGAAGLMDRIAEAQEKPPETAAEWKEEGSKAYKASEWDRAVLCYSTALERCGDDVSGDLALACKNNRAACYAQLKDHEKVIKDTSEVLKVQPANTKALLRRMVAADALERKEDALKDAASVLTMEPKNKIALDIVEKKKKSLTKKATDNLKSRADGVPRHSLCVFLFSEDRPLQCYACIKSLKRHVKNVMLKIHVFWQAKEAKCIHSYQLLQSLPDTARVQYGDVCFMEVGNGKLFTTFSRTINRLSVEGELHVLFLSDSALFHSDVDVTSGMKVLRTRTDTWSTRLDVNPRVQYFPEAQLLQPVPHFQNYAEDARLVLWKRQYDKSKQAFEAVPREVGWDAILDWTATILRVDQVQHFFSALIGEMDTAAKLDAKAADWLSRRQRMKKSELAHRTACFEKPAVVVVDPEGLRDARESDAALRSHLFARFGPRGQHGEEGRKKLAEALGWKFEEVMDYFKEVDVVGEKPSEDLISLLEPERFQEHYWDSREMSLPLQRSVMPGKLSDGAPVVSWLVPVRNMEAYLLDCLKSIDGQRSMGPGSYEVVLVEDGSDDGTLAIARKYAESRPYIRIIENGTQMGVANSLCEGWKHCKGEYVARLDADDIAEPERLETQLRYLEQHKTISVLGSHYRPFWNEVRICTIEKCGLREDGRMAVVAWREFHGNQTSRQREPFTVYEKNGEIVLADSSSEYFGCRIVRVGEESMVLHPERWAEALKSVQGHKGDVVLHRRDAPEPAKGSNHHHPMLVRASLIFEDALAGTTACFRRSAFKEEGPFAREEAECHWGWLTMEHDQHAANIVDPLVRTRRHQTNHAAAHEADIYESRLAAIQYHMTKVHGVEFDMHDAAALHNLRGPRTPEQGKKLLLILNVVEQTLLGEYVRPKDKSRCGLFWKDFIEGKEVALERCVKQFRVRMKDLAEELSKTIQSCPEHSPRQHRSRTPPR